jgi:hypothetical protein
MDSSPGDDPVKSLQHAQSVDIRAIIDAIVIRGLGDPSLAELAARRSPGIFARISGQISVLAGEDVLASLENLHDTEFFYYPGVFHVPGSIHLQCPMDSSGDTKDLRLIASNRRFLKLLEDLGNLPRTEAGMLVRDALQRYRKLYEPLFEECISMYAGLAAQESPKSSGGLSPGIAFQVSNNPDGSPALTGARLALLSLIVLAGELHLHDLRSELLEIAKYAATQREMFYGLYKANSNLVAMELLLGAGIYNRTILATALRATGELCETGLGMELRKLELTKYNALRSVYDLDSLGIPVDFSGGKLAFHFVVAPADSDVDACLGM